MACACKNKIKKTNSLIPEVENNSIKPLGNISLLFLKALGRIILVFLTLTILPLVMVFLLIRFIFIPEKRIVFNLDKMIDKWKKHTE